MEKTAKDVVPFTPSTNNQTFIGEAELYPSKTSVLGNGVILITSFVFGIFMNSLILYLLMRKCTVLNKSTTTILLHLATSDLIACLIVMPIKFVVFVSNVHPYLLCVAYYALTNFTLLVDCGCHVLLSIDRCCSVRPAQSFRIPVYWFQRFLAVIWGVALGNAVLTALTGRGQNPWVFEEIKPLLDAGTIVIYVFIWITLAAVVISFIFVNHIVKEQDREAENNFGRCNSKKRTQRRFRILKLTTIAIVSLVVLYFPFMLSEYVHRLFLVQSPGITSFSKVLVSVPHAFNLVFYTGISKTFRDAVWRKLELHTRRINIRSLFTNKRPIQITGWN